MDISPIADRLHSDYVPNVDEIDQISERVAGTLREVAALESEMTRIESAYAILQQKRDILLRDAEDDCSLLSPVRQLPLDILQEIFVHTLPTDRNALMKRYECPLLLTQVCIRWRRIAFSVCQLWATIHISVPTSEPKLTSCIAAVGEWLGRAGGVPLKVSFVENQYHLNMPGFKKLFSAVLPFSRLFKQIDIIWSSSAITNILALNAENVPLLESFGIDSQSSLQPYPFADLKLCKATRLRKLSIRGYYDLRIMECGWSNLTHLKILHRGKASGWIQDAEICLPHLFRIVDGSPLLEDLHIEVHYPTIYRPLLPASSTIALPRLRHLSMDVNFAHMDSFFALLHIPVLETFTLKKQGEYTNSLGILQLLSQSSTTIRVLGIDHLIFGQQSPGFLKALRSCIQLRFLTVYAPHNNWDTPWDPEPVEQSLIDNKFLDFLAPASDYAPFPHLENLKIPRRAEFTEKNLLDFIKRRQDMADMGFSKLKHLQVAFSRHRDKVISIDEELKPFQNDGLLVELTYLNH